MAWELVWIEDEQERKARTNGLLSLRETARRLGRSVTLVKTILATSNSLRLVTVGGRDYITERSVDALIQGVGVWDDTDRVFNGDLPERYPGERQEIVRRIQAQDPSSTLAAGYDVPTMSTPRGEDKPSGLETIRRMAAKYLGEEL